MQIKAIETTWKGFRFRSRLEARWGKFFDALGLKWTYEAEGYDLGGEWYLPDFKIDDSWFVEIKPTEPSEEERRKADLLSALLPTYIFVGQPWPGECYALQFPSGVQQKFCQKTTVVDYLDQTEFSRISSLQLQPRCLGGIEETPRPIFSSRLMDAFRAARGARFEHGEQG